MLSEKKQNVIGREFRKINDEIESRDNNALVVTSRMIRTVYVEVKTNVPFSSHRNMVILQDYNGLNMGFHHYDKNAATRMTKSISNYMHEILLSHFMRSKSPFSLILDSSSDNEGLHYLATYLQALESNSTVVYFYKLIELTSDITAAGHFNRLVETIESEKVEFARYFKKYMRGYASDGAAVMTGHRNGLVALIRQYVEEPIYAVHCMAHKLQLSLQKAFSINPFFKEMDTIINHVYAFYSRGEKRDQHLRETALNLKSKYYRLTYIYDVRWVSSQLHAMQSLLSMWHVVVTDLDKICSSDSTFSLETRKRARNLTKLLKGKKFLAIFIFIIDILEQFKIWSERMQLKTSLLADYGTFNEQITSTFDHLKENDGGELIQFLSDVQCSNLINYYNKDSLSYRNIKLENQREPEYGRIPFLHIIRSELLTAITTELGKYFPEGHVKNFAIFNPRNLPVNIGETSTYGNKEVQWLCEYFQLGNCVELMGEFHKLLRDMIDNELFCAMRQKQTKTVSFWSEMLRCDRLAWTEKVKNLVQIILVITTGSTEAERGFSIMNHAKYDRRSRLSGSNLDHIMRIRMNGPNDMASFSAAKFAKRWISENHYRTDDPNRIIKMGSKLKEDKEEDEEFFQNELTSGSTLF